MRPRRSRTEKDGKRGTASFASLLAGRMAVTAARPCAGRVHRWRQRTRRDASAIVLCCALLGVAGCASTDPPAAGATVGSVPIECAPFARAVARLPLRGAAADWWVLADGRYARGQTPRVGSILVFRRTARLPDGHVAVVSSVVSDRRILVTHANWVRHQVSENVPVIDVSAGNDWTRVRVWWPPAGQIGATEYATFGFIAADDPPRSDQIAANTQALIKSATRE